MFQTLEASQVARSTLWNKVKKRRLRNYSQKAMKVPNLEFLRDGMKLGMQSKGKSHFLNFSWEY